VVFVVTASGTGARLHHLDDELLLHPKLIPSDGVGLDDRPHRGIHTKVQAMWSGHVLQHHCIGKVLEGQHNLAIVPQDQTSLGVQSQPIGQHPAREER